MTVHKTNVNNIEFFNTKSDMNMEQILLHACSFLFLTLYNSGKYYI